MAETKLLKKKLNCDLQLTQVLKNECYNVYLGIHKNTTGLSYISSSLEVLEYIIVTYIVYTYIYIIYLYTI